MEDRLVDTIIEAYNLYFQRKLGSVPGVWKKTNEDHYCFLPSHHITEIEKDLRKVQKLLSPPMKFLDCGCGIGNIMLLAQAMGFIVYGIEYEEETALIAKELIGNTEYIELTNGLVNTIEYEAVIQGDITTFKHYSDYDVIYYFTPIKNLKKMRTFTKKLAKDMKVGSIVISYGGSTNFPNDKRFETLSNMYGVYRKIRK